MLSSPSHAFVKFARGLQLPKLRQKHGLFLAEGRNAVEAALRVGWPIQHLLLGDIAYAWFDQAKRASLADIVVQDVSNDVLKSIANAETSPGIIALCELPPFTPQEWHMPEGLLLVLDGISDPGNVGTLIRAADAAGAGAILLTEGCADPYASKVVRASAGSIFQIPILLPRQRTAQDVRAALNNYTVPSVAAVAHQGQSCFAAHWPQRCALILGHETRGISHALEEAAQRVTIPMYGQAESLNVAMAGTVLLYAWRQGQA